MEYFNKILCVTYAELTGGGDAVIKAATLRQNMSRGNIVSVHRGGGEGGQALYAWSSPFLYTATNPVQRVSASSKTSCGKY